MITEKDIDKTKPWQGLHISNLLTYISLASGIIGYIAYLKTENINYVGLFLCLSFIFDIFDGHFARAFKNRSVFVSELGGYLDSLTDFAVFGILPGLAILQIPSSYFFLDCVTFFVVMFFLICSMTRLGAFHILSQNSSSFIGLPTTLCGLFLSFSFLFTDSKIILCILLMALSFLMVASFSISRPQKKGLIVLACFVFSVAVFHYTKITRAPININTIKE